MKIILKKPHFSNSLLPWQQFSEANINMHAQKQLHKYILYYILYILYIFAGKLHEQKSLHGKKYRFPFKHFSQNNI